MIENIAKKMQFSNAIVTWLKSFPTPPIDLDLEMKEFPQVAIIAKLLQFFLNSEDFDNIDAEFTLEEVSYEDPELFMVPRTLSQTTKYLELAISNHINSTYSRLIRQNNNDINISCFNKVIKIDKALRSLNFEKLILYHNFDHLVNFLELVFRIAIYSSPTSTLSIITYQGLVDQDKLAIENLFNEVAVEADETIDCNIILKNESVEDEFNMQMKNYQLNWDNKQEEFHNEREFLLQKVQYLENELELSKTLAIQQDPDPDNLYIQSLLWEIEMYQTYIRNNTPYSTSS